VTDSLDGVASLRPLAAGYARVALATIEREFPGDAWHTWRSPEDAPPRPRERTPVFWGSYDWHSSVEMHWVLVRLLRLLPDAIAEGEARATLEARFHGGALAREAAFIADPDNRNRERPYGWGWALALAHELGSWGDRDGRRWRARFEPLVEALEANFLAWLPRATYPVRHGVHANSAFGLGLALPHAEARAAAESGAGRAADRAAAEKPPLRRASGAEIPEVGTEIDVRGFEADDAVRAVERFLEDAAMSGHQTARIIHGKGKGILRDQMKRFLTRNSLVKEFRLGEMGEGGTGVTVVTLS